MTRLENAVFVVCVLLAFFVLIAIGIESDTGKPARVAIEDWLRSR